MLTFTLAAGGVRLSGADRALVAFPTSKVPAGDLSLLARPAEEPVAEELSWPGEYDVAGIAIRGIGQQEGQHVSFVVTAEGIRCAFLVAPLLDWSSAEFEQLGEVHVLILTAADAKRCQHVLEELDPRVLILLAAADGSVDPEVLRVCGATGREHLSEVKVKTLPVEGREVSILAA